MKWTGSSSAVAATAMVTAQHLLLEYANRHAA